MELKTKNEEHTRQLSDVINQRARFQTENGTSETFPPFHLINIMFGFLILHFCAFEAELSRQMEERESLISQLTRGKQGFTSQIDELRRLIDEESKVRTAHIRLPRPPDHLQD